MNKLVIATYLFGFIALAATAPASEKCFQILAYELYDTEVPKPVSAYVAHLDSVLPADVEHEWDEAEFKKIEGDVEYPWTKCENYVQDVFSVVEEVLARHNDCAEVIKKALGEPKQDDDQALKELRKDAREILGPKMKAKNACTQFRPYREIVAVPPCFQKTVVGRAQNVYMPEELQQFVIEARKMRGSFNQKSQQKLETNERKKKCKVFLNMLDRMRLYPNKEECPEDWDNFTISHNKLAKLAFVMKEDKTYKTIFEAQFYCSVLNRDSK